MIKPYVCLGIYLLGATAITGCVVTQGDIQALRADIAALERDQAQQRRQLAERLEKLDSRMSQPESEIRRELAQTMSTNQEIRVELQTLRGQVDELQYHRQSGSGAPAEMGEILADKVAEIETRVFALEQRVDPQLSARATASKSPTLPAGSHTGSEPAGATMPALARDVPEHETKPPERTQPATRPLTTSSEPVSGQSDADAGRLYERAKQEYDAKNYEVAAVLFKQFLREHPKHTLAGNSQYWLGETFYAQRQYEAAIVAFDEVIQKYGDNAKVAASILKQGYAFDALDDSRNARFFLEQVQRKFPDSEEAKQAAAKLKTLK